MRTDLEDTALSQRECRERASRGRRGSLKRKGTLQGQNLQVGLPWWCSGSESACQCRGHGFEPWSGKIPHAAEQLGP